MKLVRRKPATPLAVPDRREDFQRRRNRREQVPSERRRSCVRQQLLDVAWRNLQNRNQNPPQ
jgi:hypothetical protein